MELRRTGGGASWKVADEHVMDHKFGRLQEIADYMYDNPAFYERFKARLITAYRKSRGLDHEWYLDGMY